MADLRDTDTEHVEVISVDRRVPQEIRRLPQMWHSLSQLDQDMLLAVAAAVMSRNHAATRLLFRLVAKVAKVLPAGTVLFAFSIG